MRVQLVIDIDVFDKEALKQRALDVLGGSDEDLSEDLSDLLVEALVFSDIDYGVEIISWRTA